MQLWPLGFALKAYLTLFPILTPLPPHTLALLPHTLAFSMPANFSLAHFDEIPPVPCPCGQSRRAFVTPDNPVASIHLVDAKVDTQTHYHKKLTEIYLILEGEGHMELDGELHPVRPMTTILIKPGCRHRIIGQIKFVNIPVPTFDPHDEWFD